VPSRPAPAVQALPAGWCDPGNAPAGQWVICSGSYTPPPTFPPAPANNPCAGDATQCLNALDPSDPNTVPVP
jgi:hypothetical protein